MAVKKSTKKGASAPAVKKTVKKSAAVSKKKSVKKSTVKEVAAEEFQELTVMDPLSIEHSMDEVSPKKVHASKEQILYAKWLDVGMKAGFVGLVISYIFYIMGIIPPLVSLEQLPTVWNLPVSEYIAATNAPAGHHWYAYLTKGDYLNFAGIAVLSGITILAYTRILPILFAKKDFVYFGIAITEIVILSAAASGLITGGGH